MNKFLFDDEELSLSESNSVSKDYSNFGNIFDYKLVQNLNRKRK